MTRVWWVLGIVFVAIATYLCLVPTQDIPGGFELNDKLTHALGHSALAAYFTGLVSRRGWWKIFVFLLLFGVSVEWLQHTMAVGREGDPRDVIANAGGAAFGLLLGFLGLSRWPQWADALLGRRSAP